MNVHDAAQLDGAANKTQILQKQLPAPTCSFLKIIITIVEAEKKQKMHKYKNIECSCLWYIARYQVSI